MRSLNEHKILIEGLNVGDKLTHKYDKNISITLIEPTSKGWKVEQSTKSGKKVKTKSAFFDKQDLIGDRAIFESLYSSMNESTIKYKKGKTYQTGNGWTVYKFDDGVHFSIDVNPGAGWQTDPNYPKEMRFMDSGKQLATYRIKSGNIEKQAKEMFDIGTKDNTEYYGLTYKDYADVIRLSIDMLNYIQSMD